MSNLSRSALIAKLHKVLKKHYKPAAARHDVPVLDALLFAACLENAHFALAEKVYTALSAAYFDWNEIRVTTVKELAEVLHELPDPAAAATRLKGILQTVFETDYSFDLEQLKKNTQGAALKHLEKIQGASPFCIACATQTALGGHFIPLDRGALGVLVILGIASDSEVAHANVAGLERAIPKSKGQEFGSLLHELGADLVTNPYSPTLKELFLSINAECKDRLPKRAPKKPPEPPPASPKKGAEKATVSTLEKPAKSAVKEADRTASKAPLAAKKTAPAPAKKPAEPVKRVVAKPRPVATKKPIKPVAKRKPR